MGHIAQYGEVTYNAIMIQWYDMWFFTVYDIACIVI